MSTQAKGLESLVSAAGEKRGGTRVLAITSGKGGVGKSTIGANLAYLLAKQGLRIGIMDADIGLANLDVMFNVRPQKNILHVLKGEATFGEIIVQLEERLWLIPGESGDEILKFSDATIVSRFLDEAQALEKLDLLLIDTGAGIGESIQMFLRASDEVIVVTVPDPAAITDAYAMIKVVGKVKEEIGMIVNQVKSPKEGEKIFETIKKVAQENIGSLPALSFVGSVRADAYVSKSVKQRILVAKELSHISAVADLGKIAQYIGGKTERKMLDTSIEYGIGGFFKRLLGQF